MTVIINVRGTNGSGKTSLAQRYVAGEAVKVCDYHTPPKEDKPRQRTVHDGLVHYDPHRGVAVVGLYKGKECGGCDKIKTQDGVQQIVRAALDRFEPRVLVFEGLLVSGLFGRYLEMDKELTAAGHKFVWAFLRPGIDECMRRVLSRSARTYSGPGEMAKLRGNVEKKLIAVDQVLVKARQAGRIVEDLPTGSVDEAYRRVEDLVVELES